MTYLPRRQDKKWRFIGEFPVSLLFPDSTSYPEFQFLPISTREKEGHISLYNETIETVPDFPVAVPDAPWHPLPDHLPPISAHLKTVAVVLCLIIVTHEPQECNIYRRHPELESLKMQAKVLTEATENLKLKILNQSRPEIKNPKLMSGRNYKINKDRQIFKLVMLIHQG